MFCDITIRIAINLANLQCEWRRHSRMASQRSLFASSSALSKPCPSMQILGVASWPASMRVAPNHEAHYLQTDKQLCSCGGLHAPGKRPNGNEPPLYLI